MISGLLNVRALPHPPAPFTNPPIGHCRCISNYKNNFNMNYLLLTRAAMLTLLFTASAVNARTATTKIELPGVYTGPSSVQLQTTKQLLDTGKDSQKARLHGRIVSYDGGERYAFADASGRLPVKISPDHFPSGHKVSAEQNVELVGELDKDFRKLEFDVDQVRRIP